MNEKKTLSVVPDMVSFRDLNVDESDLIDVWVTNVGKKPTQIRYSLQPNSKFSIYTVEQAFTAPGLDSKVTVKYSCRDNIPVKEFLSIDCPDCSIKLPITASPPCARIVLDSQKIALGSIGVSTSSKFTFSITNIGVRDGEFSLSCSDETVIFMPSSGVLSPNRSSEISATIKPTVIGDFEFQVLVSEKNQRTEEQPSMMVSGTAVQHSLALLINDIEVNELDFKTVFFGQKRIIDATVINRGPYKRSFVVLPPRDSPTSRSTLEENKPNPVQEEVIFTAIPAEGLLNPYGSATLRFVFNPLVDRPPTDDIESLFNQYSSIEVVETSQRIDFQLIGKAVHHLVSLSQIDFLFDTISVKTTASHTLTIKNSSHFLETHFNVKPVAHFRFEPSKSIIAANSSKTINVTFYPKNLGNFEMSTSVSFCDGLMLKKINLLGSSTADGKEKKAFSRVPVWETDEETRFRAEHPDKKYTYDLKELEENKRKRNDFDGILFDSRKQREEKEREIEKLDRIRKKAIHHLEQSMGHFNDEDIDEFVKKEMQKDNEGLSNSYDIDDTKGLAPPDPPLRNIEAPLYIPNPEKFGLIQTDSLTHQTALNSRSKVTSDDTILIKKKFKPKPSTPAEINECSHPLTPAQQLLVISSHETMNFGQISVFSTVVKSFTIANNLQQHIFATMNFEYEELGQSGPISQVIPPKQTAGFDIKFSSSKPQNFVKTIQYTINGCHSSSLNICAQIIPIDLQLSRNIIEFRFSPDSNSPVIKEFVTVLNKSNAKAEYSWSNIVPPFGISTQSGFVEANKSHNIEISYHPSTKAHDEATLIMNVAGGPSKALKCVGDVGSPKCSISKKILSFGLIPIGLEKSQSVRIKNSGEDDAVFSVMTNGSHELIVSPMNGRICAHESLGLQVSFKAMQARSFDLPVHISICGSPPIIFNVTGQSELPQVQLINNEFDFGRVFVGSYQSLEATIKNTGAIPAILFLDLSNHPEFRIEFNSELSEKSDNDKQNSISLVSDPFFVTKIAPTGGYMLSSSPSSGSLLSSTGKEPQLLSSNTSSGLTYRMQIMNSSALSFALVFQPKEPGEHSFELPITMMNVISSSSFHLQPIVSAEAVHAPLFMSVSSLDFGISPIFNPMNPHSRSVTRSISLFNKHLKQISWRFDTNVALFKDNSVFSINQTNGTLEPGSSIVVHFSFTPKDSIPYNAYVPLFAKTERDESIVGKAQVTGVGSPLMYSMSHQSICLPVVPLNIKATSEVYVINSGFVEGLLRVQLSVDENAFPLKITFPEGNQLQHTTEKLPIMISFCSPKPMSFSTVVAITDEFGRAASFTVTCTSDNSVFTLYPFFYNNPKLLQPKISSVDFMSIKADLPSRFLSTKDIMDLKDAPWEPSYVPMMEKFVQRYFNALVFSTQLSIFPDDLISTQGSLILETVSGLIGNGKRNPSDTERPDSVPEDKVFKRLEGMKKLINSLKGLGGLLANIKPEFLMSRSDFMQLMRIQVKRTLLGIDYFNAPKIESLDQKNLGEFTSSMTFSNALIDRLKVLEGLYQSLSHESWMIVLMQVYKIFVLSRVSTDKFSSIPGIADALKHLKTNTARSSSDDVVSVFNKKFKDLQSVYNPQEITLLKWINIHHCSTTNDLTNIIMDFGSLSSSGALASLIRSHTSIPLNHMNTNPNDRSQKEQNAIEFTNALKELKLAFMPQADEIIDGSQCMNVITSGYLFETLPHFLPVTTIEFTTSLHKNINRAVSVSNPSKSEILYRAMYEGSNCFQINQESILVGPNQTVDFPIQFIARSLKPATGRLSLIPSKPRFVSGGSSESTTSRTASRAPQYSAPIVVDLLSNVTVAGPDSTLHIEASVYQQEKIVTPIKNILGVSSKLKVFAKTMKISDENGKPIGSSKSLSQQIAQLMMNPNDSSDHLIGSPSKQNFNSLVESHKCFIVGSQTIIFDDKQTESSLEIEFVPISLGSFRCLILFTDTDVGEFVYEVIGHSILPPPLDISSQKFKAESGKKSSSQIPLEIINPNLMKSLAYSIERFSSVQTPSSERKFREILTRKQHDIESLFRQSFVSAKFSISVSSPQFFDAPNEITLQKNIPIESSSKSNNPVQNSILMTFKPTKAGDYPCKIVAYSQYDIRVFQVRAIGVAATKELSIEFNTVAGKSVKQDLPFHNPSQEVWQYKVSISGDNSFTAPQRFSVKPGSSSVLTIQFVPYKLGSCNAEMTVFNMNKDSTVIYKLAGIIEEPPAEEKIVVDCQARQIFRKQLPVKKFIHNGIANVTSTIPIITHPKEIQIVNGELSEPFEFSILAPRSGYSAGIITFTDPLTKNYIWYIVEIHVDSPAPEQTLVVNTIARKCVTVAIPITNPKDRTAKFTVSIFEDDIFGDKEFTVPPNSTLNYNLIVSPLKSMKRVSSVYFYSDDDGEFWYCLKIESTDSPESTLAPLSAPIGKFASTFILLENPLDKPISVRVDNDNSSIFQVIAKRMLSLSSQEKRRIEVRYIPSSVGEKEYASISFKSSEIGDWRYRLTGTGKPPQPLSPTIVSSVVNSANSALVLFSNPFSFPSRFSVSMNSEYDDVFGFLVKKKVFSLNSYGEEFQIPFTFSPKILGQFKATIVVAYLGPSRGPLPALDSMPGIRWIFPIIGNSLVTDVSDVQVLRTRSQEPLETIIKLTLVGEMDNFNADEYSLILNLPPGFEYISSVLDIRPNSVTRSENTADLHIQVKFAPQRPLQSYAQLTIKNPLGQEWQFRIDIHVDLGKPIDTIILESLLNKTGKSTIKYPTVFRAQTPFHAYFATGSAAEFSVSPSHGMINPSTNPETEMPIEIVFAPKMYGKILKGLLVIDTLDSQFLYDIVGKTPEYVPPVVESGLLELKIIDDMKSKIDSPNKMKKNTLKDSSHSTIKKPVMTQKNDHK